MSTDDQRYSTANQADAIAAYAANRGLTIVRTYRDEGRSGLLLRSRDALQQLLNDAQSGNADFEFIIVYDVRRWGRFQDADESAYYEFICKQAGIQVLYCAELFENDGSLASTILKHMRRGMAGDYSRELSIKVFTGQARMARMGFWMGGRAPYGLRRLMIDESSVPKVQMENGQRKNFKNDRVILIPGPQAEVEVVTRIFTSFAIDRKRRSEIAAELNADRIVNSRGRIWEMQTINNILKNEKYLGHNVYNRHSFKLLKGCIANPPELWIRRDNAFKAIIAPKLFARAQKLIAERRIPSDQELLDRLSSLLRRKGCLSADIIKAAKTVPHPTVYIRRFGSLTATYKRIGYRPKPRYRFAETAAKTDAVINSVVHEIVSSIERRGGRATFLDELHLLTISEGLKVSVCAAWSIADGTITSSGHIRSRRWQVRKLRFTKTDLTLVIRMDEANVNIQDFYWLPTVHLAQWKDHNRRLSARFFPDEYRHDNLDEFYRWCAGEIDNPSHERPCFSSQINAIENAAKRKPAQSKNGRVRTD